eukprot:1799672-Rhodomonas_salina.3
MSISDVRSATRGAYPDENDVPRPLFQQNSESNGMIDFAGSGDRDNQKHWHWHDASQPEWHPARYNAPRSLWHPSLSRIQVWWTDIYVEDPGVVHMVGGFSGLMGAIVVGPRKGRFEPYYVVISASPLPSAHPMRCPLEKEPI